jgi:hypothetical protein
MQIYDKRELRYVLGLLMLLGLCASGCGTATGPRDDDGQAAQGTDEHPRTQPHSPGDDITQGLYESVMSVPCNGWKPGDRRVAGYEGCRRLDETKERNKLLVSLEAILKKQSSSSNIECLILDYLYEQVGSNRFAYQNFLAYHCEACPVNVAESLRELGFRKVEKQQWSKMRPWITVLADRKETDRRESSVSCREVIVVSYYNGTRWKIKPWFHIMAYMWSMGMKVPDADAFYTLLEFLHKDLNPPASFALGRSGRQSLLFSLELLKEAYDKVGSEDGENDDR